MFERKISIIQGLDLIPTKKEGFLNSRKLLLIPALLLLPFILLRLNGFSIWDDSYIFYRTAFNLHENGIFAFNLADPPSFVVTSVGYTGWIALFTSLSFSPAIVLAITSFTFGILLILRIVTSNTSRHSSVFLSCVILFAGFDLSIHLSSGMDTTFAMFWLALFTASYLSWNGSKRNVLMVSLFAAMAYWIRPEYIVFSIGVPWIHCLLTKEKLQRKKILYRALAISSLSLVCVMMSFLLWGNIFPLAFHLKSGAYADTGIQEMYRYENILQLGMYFITCLPVVAFLIFAIRKRISFLPSEIALLLMSGALIIYYTFFITMITGEWQRFYFHTWPVLVIASAHILYRQSNLFENFSVKKVSLTFALIWVVIVAMRISLLPSESNTFHRPGNYDMPTLTKYFSKLNWPALDRMSKLPDDLVIGTTELGLPAVINPSKKILDLVGLTDPTLEGKSRHPDSLCTSRIPDLIYLPHPHYAQMNLEYKGSKCFNESYIYYSSEVLNSWQEVAIAKSSPYFSEMKSILEQHRMNPAAK